MKITFKNFLAGIFIPFSILQVNAQTWTGTSPYYVNPTTTNVAIGTSTIGSGNKLEIAGGNVRLTDKEFISTFSTSTCQYRAIGGSYGLMLRNDGSNSYFLLTASGSQYGTWNTLRPFKINNVSGDVTLINDAVTFKHSTGQVYVGDVDAFAGNPTLKMSVSFNGGTSGDCQPGLIVSKKITSTGAYRRMLFVPHLFSSGFRWIAEEGDMGIIADGGSSGAGLVIAPSGSQPTVHGWAGMRITNQGNVGICTRLTTNPDNFKLAVAANNTGTGSGVLIQTAAGAAYSIKSEVGDNTTKAIIVENSGTVNFKVLGSGNVYARSVTVQLGAFPDYVFKKEYKLMPLKEVEKYIAANGKLPEVPSEKEIVTNGADLGELVKIQMQKIEELTLYIIEQNKRIEALELEKNK